MSRVAVVTGAAGGLGRATARQLLAAGFGVVAVTRDASSADALKRDLRTAHTLHADLLDRAAIAGLAVRLRDTVERVDALINNAGAAFPSYAETTDGVERTFALNHLAPFQLTHLLLAGGLFAPDARIINVSSDLVSRGRLDPAEPDVTGVCWRDRFAQLTVYGSAKLANELATGALAARLPEGMSARSFNPGILRTGFNAKAGGMLRAVAAVSGLFAQKPDKAAGKLVRAVTEPVPATGPPDDLAAAVYERTARVLA